MDVNVPYLLKLGNLPKILDKIQRAGAPETFNVEFLKDLGFTSSQDRPVAKLFKYIGLLDLNGHPTAAYREFMDQNKAKAVLATRLRSTYDDLFTADRDAQAKSVEHLKGWFKTKTGAGDSVAEKMAATFKTLANYADFKAAALEPGGVSDSPLKDAPTGNGTGANTQNGSGGGRSSNGRDSAIGLVYRFEIHLPDTQNVDTFRAIFRALREELM